MPFPPKRLPGGGRGWPGLPGGEWRRGGGHCVEWRWAGEVRILRTLVAEADRGGGDESRAAAGHRSRAAAGRGGGAVLRGALAARGGHGQRAVEGRAAPPPPHKKKRPGSITRPLPQFLPYISWPGPRQRPKAENQITENQIPRVSLPEAH
jgi:hypothetical protein